VLYRSIVFSLATGLVFSASSVGAHIIATLEYCYAASSPGRVNYRGVSNEKCLLEVNYEGTKTCGNFTRDRLKYEMPLWTSEH
jgi:hypothetical protein